MELQRAQMKETSLVCSMENLMVLLRAELLEIRLVRRMVIGLVQLTVTS